MVATFPEQRDAIRQALLDAVESLRGVFLAGADEAEGTGSFPQAAGLATLNYLERRAWEKLDKTNDGVWWDRLLTLQGRKAKLLGLDHKEPPPPHGRSITRTRG